MEREFLNIGNKRSFATSIVRAVDGFSMVELMIAIGLSAILLMGITSMNSLTHTSMNTMQAVLYRDEIVKIMQQLSSNPMALKRTANYSANTELNACVNPPGGAGANPNCTDGTEYPYQLVDIANNPVTGRAPIPISDLTSPGTPFYYSVSDGSLCRDLSTGLPIGTPNNTCAFEVVTSFKPTCADSNNCQDYNKMAISFQYRVRMTTATGLNPLNGAPFKPVIAPPAPLSYVNVATIRNGYFTN